MERDRDSCCKDSLHYKTTPNRKTFSFDCQNFQLFPVIWNFISVFTFNTVILLHDARESIHFTMKKVTFISENLQLLCWLLPKIGQMIGRYAVFWKTLISGEAHIEKVLALELFQPFFSKTELTSIHINKLCSDCISELKPKSLGMEEMISVSLHLYSNLGF